MQYYIRDYILLKQSIISIFQWLSNNKIKGNAEKCRVMMSTNKSVYFQFSGLVIDT